MTPLELTALAEIQDRSRSHDSLDSWPGDSLDRIAECGRSADAIPLAFGGSGRNAREIFRWQMPLAAACLPTAFVQSQRDAACQRIALSPDENLKSAVFREILQRRRYVTVGLSHLTTSRQHCHEPAVRADAVDGGYRLAGSIPWVTGAGRATWIVAGGTLPDGRQLLGLVALPAAGVAVGPSMPLMALSASQTASVTLTDVFLPPERVLAGPADAIMKQGGGGAGSLTTSALATGHALGNLKRLKEEAKSRPELLPLVNAFQDELDQFVQRLLQAVEASEPIDAGALRESANSLALRTAQTLLAVAKGAGYVRGHPAERAVREAMFFLVWSCPQPVVWSALQDFARLPNESVR